MAMPLRTPQPHRMRRCLLWKYIYKYTSDDEYGRARALAVVIKVGSICYGPRPVGVAEYMRMHSGPTGGSSAARDRARRARSAGGAAAR